MVSKDKKFGQFFTPESIAEFMVDLISKNKKSYILEPSAGKGIFLKILSKKGYTNIKAYEIDKELPNISNTKINYSDFLKQELDKKFDIVIGNPPYVRWKNLPKNIQNYLSSDPKWYDRVNSLADLIYPFIFSSVDALKDEGELIFITPIFWMKTTHANQLRRFLSDSGEINCIINFNEMRIFDKVSSTIIIFKYTKTQNKTHKPIKIVTLYSKSRLNDRHLKEITNILNNLSEDKSYIQYGIFEAYLHPQFNNGTPWTPIPPQFKSLIDSIEKSSQRKSPKVKYYINQQPKTKLLSELFLKDDLEELEIPIKNCDVVKFADTKYYSIKNSGMNLDFFVNQSKKYRYVRLGDIAHIGNGLVSGLDKAFRVDNILRYSEEEKKKIISVVKAYDLHQYYNSGYIPYIFVNSITDEYDLKVKYPTIFSKLLKYKKDLEKRYSYNRYIPWWHWVFLRNWELFNNHKKKIFCPCKERIDKKQYARFSYIEGDFLPTQDVTAIILKDWVRESIKYILAILNSNMILTWMKYKGLSRGGVLEFSERPLSIIPMRMIDWTNKKEVDIHNEIVETVNKILGKKQVKVYNQQIEYLLKKLIDFS